MSLSLDDSNDYLKGFHNFCKDNKLKKYNWRCAQTRLSSSLFLSHRHSPRELTLRRRRSDCCHMKWDIEDINWSLSHFQHSIPCYVLLLFNCVVRIKWVIVSVFLSPPPPSSIPLQVLSLYDSWWLHQDMGCLSSLLCFFSLSQLSLV